ncbi:hypothetical protein OG410_04920 [Streptomyces sp. NBC_00659]|jgi:hypothetical protein|uniref:hypothetical protein n=1 Tax=Streptomyces sp. NBC_00659 TaxID=2903669 RepID=UPI002E322B5D|nr:hypothetical protein [Streptomyces sp. NBC_00659]
MSKVKSPITLVLIGIMAWVISWGLGMNAPGAAEFFCPRAETRAVWHADDVKQAQDPRGASISRP